MVAQFWGCGKKGPPLSPFVRVPAQVTELVVRQLGDEVYVSFTLPVANQDGTTPADLARVDVYAMTTQPRVPADRTLDLEEFEEAATLVATVEVRSPGPPVDTTADPAGEVPVEPGPMQGFPVSISETLAASTLVPVDPWEDEREEEEDDDDEQPEAPVIVLMTPPLSGPLQREYVVVGVSSKGDESEAQRIAVSLVMPPAPPPAPMVTYTEEEIVITWELPPGVRSTVTAPVTSDGSLTGAPLAAALSVVTPAAPASNVAAGQTGTPATTPARSAPPSRPILEEPPASSVLPSRPIFGLPILQSRPIVTWPPASRYDLYEIVESLDGSRIMPRPLNMAPLMTLTYDDSRVEFGVERCYAVTTLDVVGGRDVRSGLSAETCVTLVDTFAPAAPVGLRAVGSEGLVSLIWRGNDEEDLAGYLVLRGVAPGATLQPLTPEPVLENVYTDTTAEPGVLYVYAVRAVDTVTPPNLSPLSDQAEAAAR